MSNTLLGSSPRNDFFVPWTSIPSLVYSKLKVPILFNISLVTECTVPTIFLWHAFSSSSVCFSRSSGQTDSVQNVGDRRYILCHVVVLFCPHFPSQYFLIFLCCYLTPTISVSVENQAVTRQCLNGNCFSLCICVHMFWERGGRGCVHI